MKKSFIVILIIFIVAFVLFLYNAFNGNPISKYMSQKSLENYLEETYPEQEFRIKEGAYNFKFNSYDFVVLQIGTDNLKELDFAVSGFFKPTVSRDGMYYENLDYEMMEKFSEQAEKEILSLLKDVNTVHNVDVTLEVLKGQFQKDTNWSKDVALQKPVDIYVQIDSKNQTKEQFFSAAEKVKKILDEQNYKYGFVTFNGTLIEQEKEGILKYSVSVNKDENIELKNVKQF